jgi:predicted enzyme related to lactoylglutathione lyase
MAVDKPGSFVHIEVTSSDPARTKKFFEEVFEWEFESHPEMDYHTYVPPSGPGGGLMSPMESQQPGILNYLLSHNIDEDVKKIEQAGGRVLRPKQDIPGVGAWALFEEPTGIVLALFEATQKPPVASRPRPKKTARRGRKAASRSKGRGRKK